jgi:hypothetical protein
MKEQEENQIKQEVIDALKSNFNVVKVTKKLDEDISIMGDFFYNGRSGKFTYILEGNERGIDEVDFIEEEDEDVYDEIVTWVEEHIDWTTTILVDGKEI